MKPLCNESLGEDSPPLMGSNFYAENSIEHQNIYFDVMNFAIREQTFFIKLSFKKLRNSIVILFLK